MIVIIIIIIFLSSSSLSSSSSFNHHLHHLPIGLSQLVRHGMSAGIQPALKVLRMHNNKLTGEIDRLL